MDKDVKKHLWDYLFLSWLTLLMFGAMCFLVGFKVGKGKPANISDINHIKEGGLKMIK